MLILALASGCTDEVIVRPVIDNAVGDSEAEAFSGLDRIEIAIAHEGDAVDVVTRTIERGEPLTIDGVPFDDDLVIHLRGFIGDDVVSYGRTCAFEVRVDSEDVTPHLFFSRTQKFATTSVLSSGRDGGRAISFLGSGLFLGGTIAAASARQIERFDPANGELTELAQVSERTGAVEAVIGTSSPRVVLVGGEVGGIGATFLELIDPNRPDQPIEEYSAAALARVDLTATSLTNGDVIAIGGRIPSGAPVSTATRIVLRRGIPEIENLPRAVLAHPRAGHTATRLGDDVGAQVLITGGLDALGDPVATAELFKPLQNEFAAPATFAPAMLVPRYGHTAARLPDGSVLIIGGFDEDDMPVQRLERFSFDTGFEDAGMLATGLLDATVTVLPDGRLLIAGGRTSATGNPSAAANLVQLRETGDLAVLPANSLATPRAGHQAAALCDGTVLITGGAAEGTPAERYNPPLEERR